MELIKTSKKNTYSEYDINIVNKHDPKIQLDETTRTLFKSLTDTIRNIHGITINITLKIKFTKPIAGDTQTDLNQNHKKYP